MIKYIFCANDTDTKLQWMTYIAKLRLSKQTFVENADKMSEGEIILGAKETVEEQLSGKRKTIIEDDISGKPEDKKNQSKDGYWKVMQDWSTCDRACGGGTQTQHRVCIEPIGSGAPCNGNAMITRPCNEQPCAATEIKDTTEVKEN